MRKVWIEAAINGGWSRAWQPGIPHTVETIVNEGIACAKAGATIKAASVKNDTRRNFMRKQPPTARSSSAMRHFANR